MALIACFITSKNENTFPRQISHVTLFSLLPFLFTPFLSLYLPPVHLSSLFLFEFTRCSNDDYRQFMKNNKKIGESSKSTHYMCLIFKTNLHYSCKIGAHYYIFYSLYPIESLFHLIKSSHYFLPPRTLIYID